MNGMDDLTTIVRERYETGAYGSARLEMMRATFDAVRAPWPAPSRPVWLGDLMSIPVVCSESMEPGAWKLVDIQTGDVLARGVISDDH